MLAGSFFLLAFQSHNKAVDDLWADFLRHTPKADFAAIQTYFDQLLVRKPALSETDLSYAITIVSKWMEGADLRPKDKAAIALLCGKKWPKKEAYQQYMPAFFFEWAYQVSEENKLYDLATDASVEIIDFYKHKYLIDKALPYVIGLEKAMKTPAILSKLTRLDAKYYALAEYYYRLDKHDLSILYHKKVLEFPEIQSPNPQRLAILNTIGLSYNYLRQYKNALHYYDEVIKTAIETNNKAWEYITKGNNGELLVVLGRLEEAEGLLLEDFHGSLKTGQAGSALNACIALAELKLHGRDLEKARYYLEASDRLSDSLGVLQKNILVWSDYYAMSGDWEKAYAYRKRADEMGDSVSITYTTQEFYHAREKHSLFQQKELMNRQLWDQQAARKTDRRNFIIALAILALALAVFGVVYRLKQREQRIVSSHLQERLTESKDELERYVRRVQHHQLLSQGLEDQLMALSPNLDQEKIRALLLQFTFSTEEDWGRFKELFDEVHHDFIHHLQQQPIHLTPGEIRLLALLKLEFNNREIARALGISLEGVKKNKQRLRKKLQDSTDTELDRLLNP